MKDEYEHKMLYWIPTRCPGHELCWWSGMKHLRQKPSHHFANSIANRNQLACWNSFSTARLLVLVFAH